MQVVTNIEMELLASETSPVKSRQFQKQDFSLPETI